MVHTCTYHMHIIHMIITVAQVVTHHSYDYYCSTGCHTSFTYDYYCSTGCHTSFTHDYYCSTGCHTSFTYDYYCSTGCHTSFTYDYYCSTGCHTSFTHDYYCSTGCHTSNMAMSFMTTGSLNIPLTAWQYEHFPYWGLSSDNQCAWIGWWCLHLHPYYNQSHYDHIQDILRVSSGEVLHWGSRLSVYSISHYRYRSDPFQLHNWHVNECALWSLKLVLDNTLDIGCKSSIIWTFGMILNNDNLFRQNIHLFLSLFHEHNLPLSEMF